MIPESVIPLYWSQTLRCTDLDYLLAECCIFHMRRQFGDWSDDNDSDSECQVV